MDFEYAGKTFSISGYDSILLSDLFTALGLEEDASHAASVVFSDPDLVGVEATTLEGGEIADWLLHSLTPFASEETLTIIFDDGRVLAIDVTDAQYTDNLSNLFADMTLLRNGEALDYLNETIIVHEGDTFVIELGFEEHDGFQFMNDDTPMYFEMPKSFTMQEGFSTTTDVSITVGGKLHTLKNNKVTYDPENNRVMLTWNTTDPEFAYLKKSGDANVRISVAGSFDAIVETRWMWDMFLYPVEAPNHAAARFPRKRI